MSLISSSAGSYQLSLKNTFEYFLTRNSFKKPHLSVESFLFFCTLAQFCNIKYRFYFVVAEICYFLLSVTKIFTDEHKLGVFSVFRMMSICFSVCPA